MNELQFETSPYLLQHANNPINWKSWTIKSLEEAKKTQKLIVVSIGYASCHWCHVMEEESFEDSEVASVMNSNFISIKIDREERPDLDSFYMKAVQLMTKQGGWPLNVVCLPDGRPIWGGTYFKKEAWLDALTQLNELYSKAPEKVYDFAEKLHEGIEILSKAPNSDSNNSFDLDLLLDKWKRSFDWEYGGYNRAPKFMMPTNLLYLQKLGVASEDASLLDYVDLTLTRMAWGGLFDTVAGGFSRYSVDVKWHIPHFEKMLYDNAQLLSVYSDAYKRTQNPLYKNVIEKTIQFIDSHWSNQEGGYFAAYDADSLNSKNELEEGAFYTWTIPQLKEIIPETDFSLFVEVYNINTFGYWENNQYVLIQSIPLHKIAVKHNLTTENLQTKKTKWEKTLYNERAKRSEPRLDNKTLTAWNSLLIIGLVDSYMALQNEEYLDKAKAISSFIETKLWNETEGLFHTYNKGTVTISGFLDDYAFHISSLLSLYETTLEESYLTKAKNLTDWTLDHFLDDHQGFFKYNSQEDAVFIASIETEDNVIPSSNAFMAHNLYKLGILYEHSYYTKLATNMLSQVLNQIDYASAYSHWLLLHLYSNEPAELSIIGKNAHELIKELQSKFVAKTMIWASTNESQIPYFKHKHPTKETMYYFCQSKTCLAPNKKTDFLKNTLL